MRPKTLILFFVAIGCGLIASIGVSQYMEKARASGGVQLESLKVYVAATEINIGDKLDDKNIKLEEWPKDRVPEGAIAELKELEGKFPRTRLYKGEPILAAKLSDEIGANVGQKIPEGFRVVTVKVNAESSSGGLIRPGDRVDLVVFLRKSQEVPETTTKTILSDVNVFACDAETERAVDKGTGQARESRTVSLLVKPQQALVVTLAKELGTMSLTLRRPGDNNADTSDGETVHSLLGSDGETANDKTNHDGGDDSGLAKFLNQAAAPVVAPPVVVPPVEEQAPAPIIEPEEPPKFVMKIRTPNGDRAYRWKDLDGEPEEVGEGPVASPPQQAPAIQPIAIPSGQPIAPPPGARAVPIRETAPRTNAKPRATNHGTQNHEPADPTSAGGGLNEKQDN